jgi:hypothetical protein
MLEGYSTNIRSLYFNQNGESIRKSLLNPVNLSEPSICNLLINFVNKQQKHQQEEYHTILKTLTC